MASGHMNRVKRPDTWLHRPMLQNVKKILANPEPSTHDPKRTLGLMAWRYVPWSRAEVAMVWSNRRDGPSADIGRLGSVPKSAYHRPRAQVTLVP
jgi:hypothetical protein